MRLAKCPYCNKQMDYDTVLIHKTDGQYVCSRCEKESNIHIKKRIFPVFSLLFSAAVIITVLFLVLGGKNILLGMILAGLPFIIFFFIAPFFIRLIPLKKYMEIKENNVNKRKEVPSIDEEYVKTTTRVVDAQSEVEEEKTEINKDVFNAIKEERKRIKESIEENVNKNKEAERKASQMLSFDDENMTKKQGSNDLSDEEDIKIYRR